MCTCFQFFLSPLLSNLTFIASVLKAPHLRHFSPWATPVPLFSSNLSISSPARTKMPDRTKYQTELKYPWWVSHHTKLVKANENVRSLSSGARPYRARVKPGLKAGVSPACGLALARGYKKPGKPQPQGQPGLGSPHLAVAKIGKEKRKKMVCMAWKGHGWPGSKLASQALQGIY